MRKTDPLASPDTASDIVILERDLYAIHWNIAEYKHIYDRGQDENIELPLARRETKLFRKTIPQRYCHTALCPIKLRRNIHSL